VCPNFSAQGVTKYLNPSPATAKGHMKRPHQGICSTCHRPINPATFVPHKIYNPIVAANIPIAKIDDDSTLGDPIAFPMPHPNIIENDDDSNNVFVFAAFADKHTGILYSDLTGTFRFMLLEGNVCFLVVYHYETNAILALPVANFSNDSILAAYQQQFEFLESKGHKIKSNMMDNQASQVIKKYLTLKKCDDVLVEPNNHHVNAAERAFRPSRCTLSMPLLPLIASFPSNYGII
jgi:hypothetical protein